MSGRGGLPRWAERAFGRLFPGSRGLEIRSELEEEHDRVRERLGGGAASLWCVAQILHPGTWVLARALRRRGGGEADPPVVVRDRRGPGFVSALDVKLGLRMLVKNPAVTAVTVFGLAVGIPVGLVPIHFLNVVRAPLPFDEGDRIVGLWTRDVSTSRTVWFDAALYAAVSEPGAMSSFELVGAALPVDANLVTGGGAAAPVVAAAVTASTFDILRVAPLIGRVPTLADEAPGGADVVVIGHDIWRSRFAGDPDVMGRTVAVDGVPHTVIGVMPEDFRFPVRHSLWLPLRLDAEDRESGGGPRMVAYGRLADGVSEQRAQAELRALVARVAERHPDTHGTLRAEVVDFKRFSVDVGPAEMLVLASMEALAVLLLLVICGNVGMLVFARTVGRRGELAIRTALGASRARILSQLFVEAFVPALLAAGLGLTAMHMLAGGFDPWRLRPFWFDLGVDGRTVALGLGLATLSAVAAGVVPAWRVTGSGLGHGLRRTPGVGGSVRFGRVSTVLIGCDVALAVFLLFGCAAASVEMARGTPPADWMGIRPEEFVTANLQLGPAVRWPGDAGVAAARERLGEVQRELVERLRAEPGVRGVTVAATVPGADHRDRRIEINDGGRDGERVHRVLAAVVDVGFFPDLDRPILAGRNFDEGDLGGGPVPVIVNTTFARQVMGGADPIGNRIRFLPEGSGEPGPWHEIVGVVGPLGMNSGKPLRDAGFYLPGGPGDFWPRLVVHVAGDPKSFIPRLHRIGVAVDPALRIEYATTLDELVADVRSIDQLQGKVFGAVALMSVVFTAAGLFALVSFLVAHRRHEIGVRTALGAARHQIVWAVGRRAVLQLVVGVVVGLGLSALIAIPLRLGASGTFEPWKVALAIAAGVAAVGLAACVPPTLEALRVQPAEALSEG